MNYKRIHDNLITIARATSAKDRIKKRNPNDFRLKDDSIYVEIHHIIPKSLGGLDVESNLVELLPEEHLIIHMLRYKIYRKREDALAVRIMLNGYSTKQAIGKITIFSLGKKIRNGYAWLRTHAYFLRKTEGWHTEDGVRRIREARKGCMPAKDAITGELVGAVRVDHPKVISGEWVHHSKGRKQSQKELEYKRKIYAGQNNPNASGLTEEYFIEKGMEFFNEFGYIPSWDKMLNLSQERKFKWIKSLRSRFNGAGVKGFYKILEEKTNTKYNSYLYRKKYVKN